MFRITLIFLLSCGVYFGGYFMTFIVWISHHKHRLLSYAILMLSFSVRAHFVTHNTTVLSHFYSKVSPFLVEAYKAGTILRLLRCWHLGYHRSPSPLPKATINTLSILCHERRLFYIFFFIPYYHPGVVCLILCISNLMFVQSTGFYLLEIISGASSIPLLFTGLVECVGVTYVYGMDK